MNSGFDAKRFFDAIKTALLSKRSREVLVFLFFVLISAGFWLMLTLNETYDVELDYPLQLVNVDKDAVVTSDLPEQIHVTLRDKGASLVRYAINRHRPSVDIDFAQHDAGNTYGRISIAHSEVLKQLQQHIAPSTRITAIRPDTIEYYYTRGVKKRVPVIFRGHIEVDPLYYLAGIHCEPDSVTVWGEKHFLDSLTAVSTMVTNMSGLKENTTRTLQLMTFRGAKVEPAEVNVTAEVDIYTQKSVKVPIVGTNFPAGLSLITFPSKATVTFRVGARDFRRYTEEDFVLTTTYEELLSLPDSVLHLELRSVPEGISQIRIEPRSVQFLIEQTDNEE
ncbi:MAG: YbbR-like domain-containing protein [Bacteroidales bacterium]|nr:YbbR-like domain-containing protein [Bacteroidales bacterium]